MDLVDVHGGQAARAAAMNELKNRGVDDLLLAVVDGLKGFPEAITAVFPEATVQTCIVHLLRKRCSQAR
jgi:transposase-like protein